MIYINKLVVIGNGFDIAHSQKTKYQDFIDSDITKYGKKYLELKSGKNTWTDIEEKYSELLADAMTSRTPIYVADETEQIISNYGINDAGEVDYYNYSSDVYDSENDTIKYYVQLLSEFEDDFLKYLRVECTDDKLLLQHTFAKVNSILKNSSTIISFNYTHTIEVCYGIHDIIHIHGDVDSHIAFGSGSLDELKTSLIDSTYPTEYPCKNKYDLQDRMLYYDEDMEGNLVVNERIRSFFYEYDSSIKENEKTLFKLIDEKNKDALNERQRIIKQISEENYDFVYVMGHALGRADWSVFDAINMDAKIVYFYFSETERIKIDRFLREHKRSYELFPTSSLYNDSISL